MLIVPEELASRRRELEARIKSAAHYQRIAQSKGLPCEPPDSLRPFVPAVTLPNRKESFCRNPPPPC
jgi:hypothetical protein